MITKGARVFAGVSVGAVGIVWFIHHNQTQERQVKRGQPSRRMVLDAPGAGTNPLECLAGACILPPIAAGRMQAMKEGPKRDIERYRAKLLELRQQQQQGQGGGPQQPGQGKQPPGRGT